MQFWGFKKVFQAPGRPWRIAPRDRGPLIQWSSAEESHSTIYQSGAFFRVPDRYKPAIGVTRGRAMRFLAKSHRAHAIVPPRDGISPVAVAGWAVARFIAEPGKWRKEKQVLRGARPHLGLGFVMRVNASRSTLSAMRRLRIFYNAPRFRLSTFELSLAATHVFCFYGVSVSSELISE